MPRRLAGAVHQRSEQILSQALATAAGQASADIDGRPVQLRADTTTPYRLVSDVVKIAQQQGMAKVGFITTPPKEGQ